MEKLYYCLFYLSNYTITFESLNPEYLNNTGQIIKAPNEEITVGYTVTIKNNLTEPVDYTIKITDNTDKILKQNCTGITIPREEIKISLKDFNGKTEIYSLSELENNTLLSTTIKALEENKYTIRVWVNNETTLPSGSNHHYHGLIQIFENDLTLAVK